MTGRVTDDLEASLSFGVRSPDGSVMLEVTAIIDTGFTDQFLLPHQAITRLGLSPSGETMVGLGDGSAVLMDVYEVDVEWNGAWKRIKAYEGDEDSLVGVGLLKEHRLTIDFVPGGEVRIEPI